MPVSLNSLMQPLGLALIRCRFDEVRVGQILAVDEDQLPDRILVRHSGYGKIMGASMSKTAASIGKTNRPPFLLTTKGLGGRAQGRSNRLRAGRIQTGLVRTSEAKHFFGTATHPIEARLIAEHQPLLFVERVNWLFRRV
jgi:hypothetical protein